MVFGANTSVIRTNAGLERGESEVRDRWVTRMTNLPATVVSTTLEGPIDGRTRTS
jgi:hypothetical protein